MPPTRVEKQERQKQIEDTKEIGFTLWRCSMEDETNLNDEEKQMRGEFEKNKIKIETALDLFNLKESMGNNKDSLLDNLVHSDIIDVNANRHYQIGVMQNIQKIYNEDRITDLDNAIGSLPEEDLYYDPIYRMVKGGALNIPDIKDPDAFATNIRSHRYFYFDHYTGVVRVMSSKVHKDLATIKNIDPTDKNPYDMPTPHPEIVNKFRSFLEELMVADSIDYYQNVKLPQTRKAKLPQNVKDAIGATKAIGILLAGTLGTVSLFMKQHGVAAMYFGTAALIANPKLLSGTKMDRYRKQLDIITPDNNGKDLWKELLETGFLSKLSSIDERKAIFKEVLLDSTVQGMGRRVLRGNISYEKYFDSLEEMGTSDNAKRAIKALKDAQNTSPTDIETLIRKTTKITDPTAKLAITEFAGAKMTATKCERNIPKQNRQRRTGPLRRVGRAIRNRRNIRRRQ